MVSASGELLLSQEIWGVTWFWGEKSTRTVALWRPRSWRNRSSRRLNMSSLSLLPMAWRLDLHPGSRRP